MPKNEGGRCPNQRNKALMIFKILCQESDADHGILPADIHTALEAYGIQASAHCIRRDVKELQTLCESAASTEDVDSLGYEIDYHWTEPRGFQITKRPISFEQLQTIAAAIRASRYLSKKEEKKLIHALGTFCSKYQLEILEQDEYWTVREKTPNEKVIQNIRRISEAIRQNRQVSFQYMKYTIQKRNEQTPRRKGIDYILSPFKILAVDGNFYLIAYDGQKIVRYRIDRMKTVWIEDEPREGKAAFEEIDARSYVKKMFGMMGGEEKRVQIRFTNDLLDTVVDRFGATDAVYIPSDERHFTVSVDVAISDQFYAWVCGFRKRATIIGPLDVVEGFKQFLGDIQGRYK